MPESASPATFLTADTTTCVFLINPFAKPTSDQIPRASNMPEGELMSSAFFAALYASSATSTAA